MIQARKRKIYLVLFILSILSVAAALVLYALRQNISLFYTPTQVALGEAPLNKSIRVGGMVEKGSIIRGKDGLAVQFTITDYKKSITITYNGILPDLFREGQGIVALGEVVDNLQFTASQVLAKHDELYAARSEGGSSKKGEYMSAELGLVFLILALVVGLLLGTIPLVGLQKQRQELMSSARYYVGLQFICIVLSYGFLTLCFLTDDFSLIYVFNNSSINLPWFYKLCAVWGGHEGSMLLWVAILSFWMTCVACFSSSLDSAMRTRVLVVLGWLSIGFILFLLTTSNPFLRQFQILKTQGRDLNPLLQDPGFLFHPPMLYMGYVGFSVAFAFAIAALWAGRVEASLV